MLSTFNSPIDCGLTDKPYYLLEEIRYFSERYQKWVTLKVGYRSDGATGAMDIKGPVTCWNFNTGEIFHASEGWWVHDKLCDTGMWDDGTRCTNWQASWVLKDILKSEGRWLRDFWWMLTTFAFGGGQARKNGMIRLKELPSGQT